MPQEPNQSNTPKSAATEGEGSGAFTPGPWAWGIDDADAIWSTTLPEDGGNVVCLPPQEDMLASLERWPANARLIAAAPELYEALDPETLEAIADEIDALPGAFLHSARTASLRGIAKRQRAAIAKAEGRS